MEKSRKGPELTARAARMTMPSSNDPHSRVIGQAMSDPAFREHLIADPATALKEAGVEVPAGVSVRVLEDSPTVLYLVLPAPIDEISEADLDAVAGGKVQGCTTTCHGYS